MGNLKLLESFPPKYEDIVWGLVINNESVVDFSAVVHLECGIKCIYLVGLMTE